MPQKIDVFLRGGLGNQLFQYAAGLYFARKQNIELKIRNDLLPSDPDQIAGVSRWPIQLEDFKFTSEVSRRYSQPRNKTSFFSKVMQAQRMLGDIVPTPFLFFGILAGETSPTPDLSKLRSVKTINSYCSSIAPALFLGDELREQIKDLVSPSKEFLLLSHEMKLLRPIVVHIRRGDYRNLQGIYGTTDYRAIERAISLGLAGASAPVWIFTDSPEDIPLDFKQKNGVTRVIGPGDVAKPLENLVLLSLGSYLICSNSTFSWWAAFLKGETNSVLFPKSANFANSIFSPSMVLSSWRGYDTNP